MKRTRLIMGMPVTVEVPGADGRVLESVFAYFKQIDERYSPYKPNSELSRINRGLKRRYWSDEMKLIMDLCEETRKICGGYFDVRHKGKVDTSGLVKGWAIHEAAKLLRQQGYENFYIEAGGDIQVSGHNQGGGPWTIGIRNPFKIDEIVKVIRAGNGEGVATSGNYLRGEHIYNPLFDPQPNPLCSLTVIGPNIFEADRFATAAFAMGRPGLAFIDALPGFAAYLIDDTKTATYTKGFASYVADNT